MATLVPTSGHKLRWSKYSSAYRARLLEGAKVLKAFLEDHGEPWSLVSTGSSLAVDDALENFVRHMHESKQRSALRLAKHAVLFVQIVRPRLKRTLKSSWNSLRCWEEERPGQFRPPLPLVLLAAILCQARIRSHDADTNHVKNLWLRFTVLVAVGFFGLLRPGELLGLCTEDIVLPNSMSLGAPFCVVRISRTKNARQMGVQQFAEIHHADSELACVGHACHQERKAALAFDTCQVSNDVSYGLHGPAHRGAKTDSRIAPSGWCDLDAG